MACHAQAARQDQHWERVMTVPGIGPITSSVAEGLAQRIGQPPMAAPDLLHLLRAHRETYKKFWRWSDAALDFAMLTGSLHTVFGWQVHVGERPNPRSLRNFPMQANGAEMLRLACCFATERGIEVGVPMHDATLVCAPLDRLDADIAVMRAAMAEASRTVLAGFELRTDVHVVRFPDRYMDTRGRVMWQRVLELIAKRSVPWSWVDRLKTTKRAAVYRLALLLPYNHWKSAGQPIRLSNVMLAEDGVTMRVRELEALGLIRVERFSRRAPVVTLLIRPET